MISSEKKNGKVVLGGEQGDLVDDFEPAVNGGRPLSQVPFDRSSERRIAERQQHAQMQMQSEGGVYKQAIDRIFAQMDRLDALEPGDVDSINAEVSRSKAVMGLTNAMVGVSKEMREAVSDQIIARRSR